MIGQTILNQIKALDIWALPSWGANQFIGLKNGVQFKIRTPIYPKGVQVKITLNSMDTYDIEVFRIHGVDRKTLKKSNGIYNDMLVDILDGLIEGEKKSTVFF